MEPTLPFLTSEYVSRLQNVQARLSRQGIDVLLVTSPENNFYLSGFQTTGYYMYQGLLVPVDGDPVPIVRSLEQTLLANGTWIGTGEVYLDTDDPAEFTARVIQEGFGGQLTLGVEETGFFLPVRFHQTLAQSLPSVTIVDGSGIVEAERMIKSEKELTYIRQACQAATAGMAAGINAVREGITENQIAAAVYGELLTSGSEYPGDQPYVAAGPRSGLAHATWSNRMVDDGDIVFLEVGGSVNRYAGAHMRVVACRKPLPEADRRADIVAEALTAAIEAIKPGARSGDVDAACRGVIEKAGYGRFFRHRTGYALGLAFPPGWGEGHIVDLKPDDDAELQPNTVFHLVPILHDPENFGIGMSETVLVTESGCKVLTQYPRELQIRPLGSPGAYIPPVSAVADDDQLVTTGGRAKFPPMPGEEDQEMSAGAAQEGLANAFRDQANWRRRKAEEFPDDRRNEYSADGLDALAAWVLTLPDDDRRLQEIGEMVGPGGLDTLGMGPQASQIIGRFNFQNRPEPLGDLLFNAFLDHLLDALEEDVIELREGI